LRRRLFNLAALGSLCLLLTILGSWFALADRIRGFTRVVYDAERNVVTTEWFVMGDGSVAYSRSVFDPFELSYPGGSFTRYDKHEEVASALRRAQPGVLGFQFRRNDTPPNRTLMIAVPFWFLAAITGVLPAAWGVRLVRASHRQRASLCASCGYDLRATPDRCPECGAHNRRDAPASETLVG
jgi:hypothetical protein